MLRQLPIDVLKIDQSFIVDIDGSDKARELVHHVIQIAQVLGKEVVAERVETVDQYTVLKNIGCQYVQGYFICRPIPSADFLAFLDARHCYREVDGPLTNTSLARANDS